MKRIVLLIGLSAAAWAQQPASAEHTAWIAESLKTMQTVKVGMSRADLLKVFEEQGGISTPRQQTYVLRGCPYIKVDVEYNLPPNPGLHERMNDRIKSISRPYLAWATAD